MAQRGPPGIQWEQVLRLDEPAQPERQRPGTWRASRHFSFLALLFHFLVQFDLKTILVELLCCLVDKAV